MVAVQSGTLLRSLRVQLKIRVSTRRAGAYTTKYLRRSIKIRVSTSSLARADYFPFVTSFVILSIITVVSFSFVRA